MNMRDIRFLVLFLVTVCSIECVSARDFKASTHLKSNRHAYALLLAGLAATNVAYLVATGKLDKTKIKRLFSKGQRAATLKLIAPGLAALLLAGGVEAYGYGYREEGDKPKRDEVPVSAADVQVISQSAPEEINQPSEEPELVVEVPLVEPAKSLTPIALPEVTAKPASSDSEETVLSQSSAQSGSSVSGSEEESLSDFGGEEEDSVVLRGCEKALHEMKTDFASSQSAYLRGLAAKITALQAEGHHGIALRDQVRAFMRTGWPRVRGIKPKELQTLLEFLVPDVDVYQELSRKDPDERELSREEISRNLDASIYDAYRFIRVAQIEKCTLSRSVCAALQDRLKQLPSDVGVKAHELSFVLDLAQAVVDEDAWDGLPLEQQFQEYQNRVKLAVDQDQVVESSVLPTGAGVVESFEMQGGSAAVTRPATDLVVRVSSEPVDPDVSDASSALIDSMETVAGEVSSAEAGAAALTDFKEAAASSSEHESPVSRPVDFEEAWGVLIRRVQSKQSPQRSDFMKSLLAVHRGNEVLFRSGVRNAVKAASTDDIAALDEADLQHILGYIVPDKTLYESYKNKKDLGSDLAAVYRLVKLTKCTLPAECAAELLRRVQSLPDPGRRQHFTALVNEVARESRSADFAIADLEAAFVENENVVKKALSKRRK